MLDLATLVLGLSTATILLVQGVAKVLRRLFAREKISNFVPAPRLGAFLDETTVNALFANFIDNLTENGSLFKLCVSRRVLLQLAVHCRAIGLVARPGLVAAAAQDVVNSGRVVHSQKGNAHVGTRRLPPTELDLAFFTGQGVTSVCHEEITASTTVETGGGVTHATSAIEWRDDASRGGLGE